MAEAQKPFSQIETELERCLTNLRIACEQWEIGAYEATETIAGILRTLLHDTSSSHSLFGQLDLLKARFYAYPDFSMGVNGAPTQVRKLAWQQLSGEWTPQAGNSACVRWVPMYSRGGHPERRPKDRLRAQPLAFEDWWKEVVLETDGVSLTRRQLITDYANNFAAAHSSQTLNRRAQAIMNGELSYDQHFASMMADGTSAKREILIHEACIRQIGFEVQMTINMHREAKIKNIGVVPAFPRNWKQPVKVMLDEQHIVATLNQLFEEGLGDLLCADELLAEQYWNRVKRRLRVAGL